MGTVVWCGLAILFASTGYVTQNPTLAKTLIILGGLFLLPALYALVTRPAQPKPEEKPWAP
jgi:hypothetical protein